MTSPPLPPMPGGLTPEWLTRALREKGVLAADTAITGVAASQVGEGVGMMSELCRLTPTYDGPAGGAPRSFIAKYASQNPTNRQIATSFNLYEREVRYFAELDALIAARLADGGGGQPG